jgi:hypothetical protein
MCAPRSAAVTRTRSLSPSWARATMRARPHACWRPCVNVHCATQPTHLCAERLRRRLVHDHGQAHAVHGVFGCLTRLTLLLAEASAAARRAPRAAAAADVGARVLARRAGRCARKHVLLPACARRCSAASGQRPAATGVAQAMHDHAVARCDEARGAVAVAVARCSSRGVCCGGYTTTERVRGWMAQMNGVYGQLSAFNGRARHTRDLDATRVPAKWWCLRASSFTTRQHHPRMRVASCWVPLVQGEQNPPGGCLHT